MIWCGRTVTGRVRKNNEDNLWASALGAEGAREGDSEGRTETRFPGALFAVADGMGGALAGEVASRLAVTTVSAELIRRGQVIRRGQEMGADAEDTLVFDALRGAVEAANACIRGEGESNPQRRGMGTTLTAVWAHSDRAWIAQVGDSRAYLFRGGHLRQLTKDQSLVGKLIEDGIISEREAERMAGRNIILQALGTDEPLDVVLGVETLEPGDLLMLCTDGLSGVLNNEHLQDDLRRGGEPEATCLRLIEAANERGGPDNITVLLVRASRS